MVSPGLTKEGRYNVIRYWLFNNVSENTFGSNFNKCVTRRTRETTGDDAWGAGGEEFESALISHTLTLHFPQTLTLKRSQSFQPPRVSHRCAYEHVVFIRRRVFPLHQTHGYYLIPRLPRPLRAVQLHQHFRVPA